MYLHTEMIQHGQLNDVIFHLLTKAVYWHESIKSFSAYLGLNGYEPSNVKQYFLKVRLSDKDQPTFQTYIH